MSGEGFTFDSTQESIGNISEVEVQKINPETLSPSERELFEQLLADSKVLYEVERDAAALAALSLTERTPDRPKDFSEFLATDLVGEQFENSARILHEAAIREVLKNCNTTEALRENEENGEYQKEFWSANDWIKFMNRYRLLDAPEDEIRLFEEARRIKEVESLEHTLVDFPQAQEFYVLALVKVGRHDDAIRESQALLGTPGDSAVLRGIQAEALTRKGDATEQNPEGKYEQLEAAKQVFKEGFKDFKNDYCLLGWLQRTIDQIALVRSAAVSQETRTLEASLENEKQQLLFLAEQVIHFDGGSESRDYWTHAGMLELQLVTGKSSQEIDTTLHHALTTVDARFKLQKTIDILERLKVQDEWSNDAEFARVIRELRAGISRLESTGVQDRRGEAKSPALTAAFEAKTLTPIEKYKRESVNFCALMGNPTPMFVEGGMARAGARVPDFMINRYDQALFSAVATEMQWDKITDPRELQIAISDFVWKQYSVESLLDLQSEEHKKFDELSRKLRLLAGFNDNALKGKRSITNLSAALLMGHGDCREVMYAMGCMYAVVQRSTAQRYFDEYVELMERSDNAGIEGLHERMANDKILQTDIRGSTDLFSVENIAMEEKYKSKRRSPEDGTGVYRGPLAEVPLSQYEKEHSVVLITFKDGSEKLVTPQKTEGDKWPVLPTEENGCFECPEDINRADIAEMSLLVQVEEHSYTTLINESGKTVEGADAFYRSGEPYSLGSGPVDVTTELSRQHGLKQLGTRTLVDGTVSESAAVRQGRVFAEAKPYSTTDYDPSISELAGGAIRFYGRSFVINADEFVQNLIAPESQKEIKKFMERVLSWQRKTYVPKG